MKAKIRRATPKKAKNKKDLNTRRGRIQDIKDLANAGKTTQQVARAHSMTAEELRQFIAKYVKPYKASQTLLSQLKTNDVNSKSAKAEALKKAIAEENEDIVVREVCEAVGDQNLPAEELLERESKLSQEAIRLEIDYRKALREREECYSRLKEESKKLDELIQSIDALDDEVTALAVAIDACNSKVSNITKEYQPVRAELDAVRTEIEAQKKVTIFVYGDGKVEACKGGDKNKTLSLSLSGWEEKKAELLTGAEASKYEDLRVKQVGIIAKALTLKQLKELEGREVEVILDDDTEVLKDFIV